MPRSQRYGGIQFSIPETFHGFYDHGSKRYINSKNEITEIEKRENKVFAHDLELDQEADKNAAYNQKASEERFDKELEKEVAEAMGI